MVHGGRGRPSAPERGFYYFDESLPNGYASWLGVPSLPKLDWRSEELHRRIGDVVSHWLDATLAGWRIDVANMTGRYEAIDLNHDVARWAREVAGGALLVAEHGHDYRPDLDGTGWHGAMNYAGFLQTVLVVAPRRLDRDRRLLLRTSAEVRRRRARERDAALSHRRPVAGRRHSWTLLDSHDTARFSTVVGAHASCTRSESA